MRDVCGKCGKYMGKSLKSLRAVCGKCPYTYTPFRGGSRYINMTGVRLMGGQPYFQTPVADIRAERFDLSEILLKGVA